MLLVVHWPLSCLEASEHQVTRTRNVISLSLHAQLLTAVAAQPTPLQSTPQIIMIMIIIIISSSF